MSHQSNPDHGHDLIKDLLIVVEYPSLRILRASHAVYLATGYTQEQLIDLTLRDLFPALDQQKLAILLESSPHEHLLQLTQRHGGHFDTTVRLDYFTEQDQSFITCIANLLDDPRTATRQLQEHQMLYHALGLGLFDLLFRIRRDGTYVDFKIPSDLGLYEPIEASEIIGRNVKDVVPPHVHDIVMPVIRRVIDTGRAEDVNYDIMEATGLHLYTARFVPSLPGEIVAVVRDTTDQRHSEMLLRHQRDLSIALSDETQLDQALLRVLKTALTIANMDLGGIYLINQRTKALELTCHRGLSDDFLAEASTYPLDSSQAQLVRQGKPFYGDYRNIPASPRNIGQRENLRAFALNPIRHNNEVIGCINLASLSLEDQPDTMTQNALEVIADQVGNAIGRIRTEEKLRENETTIRALINASTDTAILVNRDYTTLAINEAGAKRFNNLADKLIGTSVLDYMPRQIAQKRAEIGAQVIQTGEPVSFEDERDGTYFFNTIYPLFDTHDEVSQLAIFARDITRQKYAEVLLRQQRDLGVALSRERNLNRALAQVLDTTTRITQMDCGGIYLVDENMGSITLSFHHGLSEEFAKAVYHYGPDTPQTKMVMAGEAIYTQYSQVTQLLDEVQQNEGLRAFALVPIRDDEHIIACIILASHSRDDIPPVTRNALEAIAVQIGSSIARIRAEEAYVKKDRLMEAVAQAETLLLASPDFAATIPLILEAMGGASQADHVFLFKTKFLPSEDNFQLHLQDAWSEAQSVSPLLNLLQAYQWHLPATFNWHKKLLEGDIINGGVDSFPPVVQRNLAKFDVKSLVLAPVFVGNKLWGIIGLEDHQTKRDWVFEEIHVLYLMAASVGTAIERQQAEEAVRYEHEKADTLVEVGMTLTSTLELDQVLTRILEQAKRVVPYDTASFMTIKGTQVQLEIFSGYENVDVPQELIDNLTFDQEHTPFLNPLFETRQPYICANVENDPNWVFRYESEWIKSWLGIPIIVRDQMVGFFALDSTQPDFYQPHHIADIEPFARQAAIAFENATLFAEVQALERIKSRMIRMASHDLRSPLRHIRTAITEITNNGAVDPTAGQQYQRIWAATDNMERLINNILSLERIEARYYTAQLIDWQELVPAIINSIEAEIGTHQHQLMTDIAPKLPNTQGDPIQLRQAIVNLLDNAIKYTPSGGQITLRAYVKPYGVDQTIAIEVEDTGPGIPYDQQTDLFHPFFRAEQTIPEVIEGIGLGLSIVKAAVDYHKGKVYFSSVPGEGSLFGFWVPI